MTFNPFRTPTDTEVETFTRDGVVCLRGALDLASVAELAKSIERLTLQLPSSAAGYDLENLGDVAFSDENEIDYGHAKQYDLELLAGWLRYEDIPRAEEDLPPQAPKGAFLLDTGCWRRDAFLGDLATSESAGLLAAKLLSSRAVGYFDDQMFVKRPGTKQKTEWHQDYPFFHIEGEKGLVLWIPVDPVTQANGGMRYVRGSHKWTTEYGASLFIARTLMPGAGGQLVPDIDANPDDFDIVGFDAEPGDVIIHHLRTIHGARGNTTLDRTRRAMSLRYVGDDMRYKLRGGAPFPPHISCELEEGQPVWCDDYPLIYVAEDSERSRGARRAAA